MALDDLLAPIVIFFAFSVPNLDKGSPSTSIPRLKRPPGMRWASLVFSSINEGRKHNGMWEISLMEVEAKISPLGDKQKARGLTVLRLE
jgi:hypothetical protein